jgi:SAM-dependent methyltransferase
MSKQFAPHYILRHPFVYSSYQKLVGGFKARRLFIEDIVRPKSGDKILDIGCGPGNILEFLPDVDYYGFDSDANYIESAKRNYGKRGTFICSEAQEFIVSNPNTFDIVIASGVIHHLNDDEAKTLFQIATQALKPSGRLVTLDGCFVNGQNIISRLLLKFDRGLYIRKQPEYEKLAFEAFKNIESFLEEHYFHVPYTLLIMDCQNKK